MIKEVFYEHKCRYGSTRICKELQDIGIKCTRTRIAERMKHLNLIAKARRKFKVSTTDSNHNRPIADNILRQDFTAAGPDQKWLSDITYVETQEGWLYLCVFIDLYSRAVIGWSMSDRMKSTLVEDALTMTLYRRKFPTNVLVHSDRGSQYCSHSYQHLLSSNKLICSMSSVGYCYDNAAMESFFHTLKVELIHDENYENREIAKTSIVEYMECYYNRKRRHSAIHYMTPNDFEAAGTIA
jgi:putative transposase